ncbi:MAG: SOS response-associated peptidase, partial [Alphaproteobacteria bacterium]|nr:SOS response-associated peptidase [Alphaproteobacteria bacterium]
DRMPLVLPEPLEAPWIDPETPFAALAPLLGPWPGALVVEGDSAH